MIIFLGSMESGRFVFYSRVMFLGFYGFYFRVKGFLRSLF